MSDVNIHELARLLDIALESENPSVKKALRNFMLIVSLVDSESAESTVTGPFSKTLLQIETLLRRVDSLERAAYKTTAIPYPTTTWNGIQGVVHTGNISSTNVQPYSMSSYSVSDLEVEMNSILKNINAT